MFRNQNLLVSYCVGYGLMNLRIVSESNVKNWLINSYSRQHVFGNLGIVELVIE